MNGLSFDWLPQGADCEKLPGLLREKLRELLPGRTAIKRARGDALFLIDNGIPEAGKPRSGERQITAACEAAPIAQNPHAPPLSPGALAQIGLACAETGGRIALSPTPELISAFERAQTPYWLRQAEAPAEPWSSAAHFCTTLLKTAGLPPHADAVSLFSQGIKLLEAPAARAAYVRAVHQLAAICLRTGTGGAFACGILAWKLAEISTAR